MGASSAPPKPAMPEASQKVRAPTRRTSMPTMRAATSLCATARISTPKRVALSSQRRANSAARLAPITKRRWALSDSSPVPAPKLSEPAMPSTRARRRPPRPRAPPGRS